MSIASRSVLLTLAVCLGLRAQTSGPALPPAFLPNLGQWPDHIAFVARQGPLALWLARGAIACVAGGEAIRIEFGNAHAWPEGERPLPGVYNFASGADPSRWVQGAQGVASALYRGAFPGVDVRVREGEGLLEYDLLLADPADARGIALRVAGATDLGLEADGRLRIATTSGAILQTVPRAWTRSRDGREQPVACRFRLLGSGTYGFAVDAGDGDGELVIDPGLEWSTYLGASGDDRPSAVAVDADGNVIVAGSTTSAAFPATTGALQRTFAGWTDAFVAKFDASGRRLAYATFFGGTGLDVARAVAVDRNGDVTVAGSTLSADFPVSATAFDRSYGGGLLEGDAYVARFDARLGSLRWSTFLGGSSDDAANALALAPDGEVVVVGFTQSTAFPTTPGVLRTTRAGEIDGFVTRIRESGEALAYSTYLGGSTTDVLDAVVLDTDGTVWIGGVSRSSDIPVSANAFDRTRAADEGYLGHLDAGATTLLASTFLGGGGNDRIHALLLHDDGTVVAGGLTFSADFPVSEGAYDVARSGPWDAFVTRFDSGLTGVQFSTFLGGGVQEWLVGVARGSGGQTIIAGSTNSPDFPTTAGGMDRTHNGGIDGYLACLSRAGEALVYGTFFGGAGDDVPAAIAGDGPVAMLVVGTTTSSDLPTTAGAFDRSYAALEDGFVVRAELDVPNADPAPFGWGTAGTDGIPRLQTNSDFFDANDEFALWISRTAPQTVVLGALATARAAPPYELGYTVNVSPVGMLSFLAVSDATGEAVIPLPVPALDPALIGRKLAWQAFAVDVTAPVGLSASRGLEMPILYDPRPTSRAPAHFALEFASVADKQATATADLLARWQPRGVTVQHDPPNRPYLHVVVPVAFERTFAADARATASVTGVAEDHWLALEDQGQPGYPNDPRYGDQWGLNEVGGPVYLGHQIPKVSVIDSGLYGAHEDLQQAVTHGRDLIDADDDSTPHGTEGAEAQHGTSVAGVIAAGIDNGRGIAGVAGQRPGQTIAPWVKVYRALGTRTPGRRKNRPRSLDLFDVLEHVVANAAPGIVNLSMAAKQKRLNLQEKALLDRAAAAGLVLCCSAGNAEDGENGCPVGLLARHEKSIAVGSVKQDGGGLKLAQRSARGEGLDLCAPGVGVLAPRFTNNRSDYEAVDGTSFAAPHVTGALAVIWSWTRPEQQDRADFVRAMLYEHAVRRAAPSMARGVLDLSGELVFSCRDGGSGATRLGFPQRAPQAVELGAGVRSMEISADRAHFVFSDGAAIWLRERAREGHTPAPDVNVSARIGVPMLDYGSPVLTPDGSKVLFTAAYGASYAVIWANVAGAGWGMLTPIQDVRDHLHVSPDGRRVLFSDPGSGIWSIDLEGGGRTLELPNRSPSPGRTISYGHPRYSPDGRMIVAHAYDIPDGTGGCGDGFKRVNTSLFLLRPGGGNQAQPVSAVGGGSFCWKSGAVEVWSGDAVCCATWSPNGRHLYYLYQTNAPGQCEVRCNDLRTGAVARVAAAPDATLAPVWGRQRLVSSRW